MFAGINMVSSEVSGLFRCVFIGEIVSELCRCERLAGWRIDNVFIIVEARLVNEFHVFDERGLNVMFSKHNNYK